jgi:Stress responsive A/B Barrel Domain
MAQRISAKEFKGMVVMIRHTVAFTLKHDAGSSAERDFLEAADVLADIPGVLRFEKLRQVSAKNDYRFGFSMEFVDQAAYTVYNEHPWHVAFVNERWLPEVLKFMEIDYVVL